MRKNPSLQKSGSTGRLWHWLLVFAVILSSLFETAQAEKSNGSPDNLDRPLVRLQAASGLAIDFQTQNGKTVQGMPPQAKEIPHLVLFRNGKLANAEERTLQLTLSGLQAPPGTGLTVTLKVGTQHGDPDQGGDEQHRIVVWQLSRCVPAASDGQPVNLTLEKEFAEIIDLQGEPVSTPSDYFRVELAVSESPAPDREHGGEPAGNIAGNPAFTYAEEYAFLMESQWVAELTGLDEVAPGAAPDELALYYGDMFTFQQDPYNPESRLPRAAVHAYIGKELSPALVEAMRVQTNEWGFPWHEDWTGYLEGSSGDRLEVALVAGYMWFHGAAPVQAHGGISINLDYVNRVVYDSLTEWIVSVFHHELFHNLQRDLNLAQGGEGKVEGKQEAWEFLVEGTAVVATSAGHSEVEFAGSSRSRSYASRANLFLEGTEFFVTGLKTSYKEIDPYSTSIYWRFLYEQCSGPQGAQGDLEIGMQILRQTLNTLYAADDLEGVSQEEIVEAIPALMNKVFSKAAWCPFRTYEESLVDFSRAIYQLRLNGGRCERAVGLAGCGFYDPNGLYAEPQVEEIVYPGSETAYSSGIGSSYGMAFVEVVLDPKSEGRSLELAFEPAPGGAAEFSVQVWKLAKGEEGQLERIPTQTNVPDVLVSERESEEAVYEVERIDTASYERLGLVITRLDSRENQDPLGAFTISLRPGESPVQSHHMAGAFLLQSSKACWCSTLRIPACVSSFAKPSLKTDTGVSSG